MKEGLWNVGGDERDVSVVVILDGIGAHSAKRERCVFNSATNLTSKMLGVSSD